MALECMPKQRKTDIWYCCKIQGSNSEMLNSPETKVLLGMYRKNSQALEA